MNEKKDKKGIRKDAEQQEKEENTQSEDQRSFKKKRQDLSVKEKENIIKWRDIFSIFMLMFLSVQYLVVIYLLYMQGLSTNNFYLDNYIFYILIAGTLVQSYFLIQIIFKYMFSHKKQ